MFFKVLAFNLTEPYGWLQNDGEAMWGKIKILCSIGGAWTPPPCPAMIKAMIFVIGKMQLEGANQGHKWLTC